MKFVLSGQKTLYFWPFAELKQSLFFTLGETDYRVERQSRRLYRSGCIVTEVKRGLKLDRNGIRILPSFNRPDRRLK